VLVSYDIDAASANHYFDYLQLSVNMVLVSVCATLTPLGIWPISTISSTNSVLPKASVVLCDLCAYERLNYSVLVQ
jgi:hypothetical protein